MLVAAIDFETTGFHNHHVATQVASAAIDLDSRKVVAQGHLHVRLTVQQVEEADSEALTINGWTPEKNDQATERDQALQQFDAWMNAYRPSLLVAHNAPFDRRVAVNGRWVHPSVPWACTQKGLKIYQKQQRVQLENNKLQTLAKLCNHQQQAAHVSALDDVYVVVSGLLYLLQAGIRLEEMLV